MRWRTSAGPVALIVAVAVMTGCAPGGAGAACTTALSLVNERAGVEALLTESSAQSQLDGRVIALFATDYPQAGLTGLGRQPELSAGGNLVWIDLGDPRGDGDALALQVGDVIEVGSGDVPITASHWTPERFDGLFGNATGTVDIRQLGESICVDLALTSDEFSVSGTISAPLEVAP